jgi:hypothetical protein
VSPTPKNRIHWDPELRALILRLEYPAVRMQVADAFRSTGIAASIAA